MALSRLQEIINGYIGTPPVDNQCFGPNREFIVDASKQSLGVKKVYSRGNVLTFFFSESHAGNYTFNHISPKRCITNFKSGLRYHSDHSSWHHDDSDFELFHGHIIKGDFELMTPTEVTCLINNIKKAEKSRKACTDGKTNCLLNTDNANEILKRYEQIYAANNQKPLASQVDLDKKIVLPALSKYCVAGAQSFAHAFVLTLVDKYIKPSLINQGLRDQDAALLKQVAESLSTLALTSSMMTTALNVIIHGVMQSILVEAGLNKEVANAVLVQLKTAAAFTENPLSLIQMGVNGTAAGLGQAAAYQVIHLLPKLKAEPEMTISREDESEAIREISSTLRRR